jgi:ubiquitin carboxyl-terminal hydrolase 34
MDLESIEVSRERAVSSEPCSSRPKPFDDTERSARKRQRLSSGSRSRSADTTGSVSTTYDTTPKDNSSLVEIGPAQPQTPTRTLSNKIIPEPTSSKVTINLRSSKAFNDRASPPSLSPSTPSKMSSPGQIARLDIEQKPDSAAARSETTSSSSSTLGSPTVELVIQEDDVVDYSRSPPVAIIDDDELLLEGDPVLEFPYSSPTESLTATLRKIIHFFEYGMAYLSVDARNIADLSL